jgi:hypothetical protein
MGQGVIGGIPGISPDVDLTEFASQGWVDADKVRFRKNYPEKIGGWVKVNSDVAIPTSTPVRNVFSTLINGASVYLVGTSHRLYYLYNGSLVNITPLKTTSTAIPNSLATHYLTLANNPITVQNGSNLVTVVYTHRVIYAGDTVTISGATGVGGIPAGDINGVQYVVSATLSTMTFYTASNATSNATGGGAAVVMARQTVSVTKVAHGLTEGARVKLSGAANTGGILAASINKEFIIRNVSVDAFDIQTDMAATSNVSAAGGAATVYFQEIDAGSVDVINNAGYGYGVYGRGAYGNSIAASSGTYSFPRIWSFDRYGSQVVLCAGDQSALYLWSPSVDIAPAIITGAPTACNYVYVDENGIISALGTSGVENRVQWNDPASSTNWTVSAGYYPGFTSIQNAGRIIARANIENSDLLFTKNAVYIRQFIDLPRVYSFDVVDTNIGLIAPNAQIVINGICYWMGSKGFYKYQGGKVQVLASSGLTQASVTDYVFKNINALQAYKSFCWHNKGFNEIWFHYPSTSSNECDRYVIYSIEGMHYTIGNINRFAGERPYQLGDNPILGGCTTNSVYEHETGANADTVAMPFYCETSYVSYDDDNSSVIVRRYQPDSNQTGNITVDVSYKYWQQDAVSVLPSTTLATTTQRIDLDLKTRFWKYRIAGSDLNQTWRMGKWLQTVDKSSPR